MKTKDLTRIAAIAAIYVVITIIFSPISYGHIQLRISEALTLLPFYLGLPAVIGLFIGVFIANMAGGLGVIDIIFGSLITLLAAIFTARASSLKKAAIYPVVFNAFGVGLILYFILGIRIVDPDVGPTISAFLNYLAHVFTVGLGQFAAVYIIGIPLMKLMNKKINLKKF